MMNKLEFEILNADSPTFAEDFIRAIGVRPGEKISLVAPQFRRTNGVVVRYFPTTNAEFKALTQLSDENLKKIGLGCWGEIPEDRPTEMLWLFPGEWYECIPDGLEMVDIFGDREYFKRGVSDDDIRFGCLPYGFVKPLTNGDSAI